MRVSPEFFRYQSHIPAFELCPAPAAIGASWLRSCIGDLGKSQIEIGFQCHRTLLVFFPASHVDFRRLSKLWAPKMDGFDVVNIFEYESICQPCMGPFAKAIKKSKDSIDCLSFATISHQFRVGPSRQRPITLFPLVSINGNIKNHI